MLQSSLSLAVYFTHGSTYMSLLTCQFIPPYPSYPPPCVHMCIHYVCVSIPVLEIGSSVPLIKWWISKDLKKEKRGITELSGEWPQGGSTLTMLTCANCLLIFPEIYLLHSIPFNFFIKTVFSCFPLETKIAPQIITCFRHGSEAWSCAIFESLPLLLSQSLCIIVKLPLSSAWVT